MKKIPVILFLTIFLVTAAHSAYALCVNKSKVNLRTGPGKNYGIAWEVYKYMPFLKVGVSLSGDWYGVRDLEGDVNWIHKNLVTDKFQCAVVKGREVNVRTGPGTNYPKSSLGLAKQYYSFKVIQKKGAWVKVKGEWDNIGWVHRDFLWIQ